MEAVEQGKIEKNSCLIVESLDRLTRQQIEDALELFLRIIKSGITIVTLADGELIFRRGELDMAKLILAIAILSRGHNESAVRVPGPSKSQRPNERRPATASRCGSPILVG